MKKIVLLITIAFILSTNLALRAQLDCQDVVHLSDYRASIMNCCIRTVSNERIVVYVEKGTIYEIQSIAVNHKGKYYDLNNPDMLADLQKQLSKQYPQGAYIDENYEYYKMMHSRATTNIAVGTIMTLVGAGVAAGGFATMTRKLSDYPESEINGAGFLMVLLGLGSVGVGIPVTIKGAMKKHQYKEYMLYGQRTASLRLQTTPGGVGLVLKF